jgi:sugar-specific transcriptional regulator TrmB
MYEEILTKFGLIPNEAKVYEALLGLGEASVQKISLKAKIHRRTVYDEIKKLIEKGLINESIVNGEKHFVATNPERLIEILKEKEQMINKVLPQMKGLYKSIENKEEARFFKGIEGFKIYLQAILDEGEDVYFIGAKAFWLDPRLQHYLRHFDKERKKRGIKFYHIFDYEVKEQKPEILKIVGKPYKFLPKKYSSQTAIDIFGDYVVTFVGVEPGTLHEEPLQFMLKSKELADGYRKFFQFMWDNLPEEKK